MLKWIHADVALMSLFKGDLIARMKPEQREACTLLYFVKNGDISISR
ncbi:MAG: hypothetical protein ABJC89_19890 [Acidobacteriota bacterium]